MSKIISLSGIFFNAVFTLLVKIFSYFRKMFTAKVKNELSTFFDDKLNDFKRDELKKIIKAEVYAILAAVEPSGGGKTLPFRPPDKKQRGLFENISG